MKEATEKNERLVKRIHTRITREKYNELTSLLERSRGINSLSELLRNILNNKKIDIVVHDHSLDMVMEELTAIRRELQQIGVNINQVTRRFHTEDLPETKLLQAMEIVKLYQQTDLKVTQLFAIIAKLSTRWLPE